MQRIFVVLALLLALLTAAVAHGQVTKEDIEQAERRVERATRALNTLLAQQTLERVLAPPDSAAAVTDSLLGSYGVQVVLDTTNVLLETNYVQVDVPYTRWDRATQREWDGTLRLSLAAKRVDFLGTGVPGRYRVQPAHLPAFKSLTLSFLTPAPAEPEGG